MINRAVKELADQLNFETGTVECDLGKSCSVFADVECYDNGWYRKMEIVAVEITRDGIDNSHPQIADYIGKKLDVAVARINAEEYQSEIDFIYQAEYHSQLII